MASDLSVVVAVYNEDPRNLLSMLDRLRGVIGPLGMSYEVVFVNDGSGERTSKALREIAQQVEYVKVVVLSRNFGQQAAISAGMAHCDGQAVVNIDSDLQDPPELIADMVRLWKEGYEVVYAQRSSRRDRFSKRLSAFLFYRVLAMVSSVKIPWDTGDYRLMDRKVIEALDSLPEKTRFLRGMVPWLGFKQVGIPIERDARSVGESTYTLRKLLCLATDGLLSFSAAPLYLIPVLGLALLALGAIGVLLCLLSRQVNGAPVDTGLVLSFMVALTGLQMLSTGIMAVYQSKITDEVRARPTYLVSERLGAPFSTQSTEKLADRREVYSRSS
jgi:dolichol-phosphate mannosyltransferase